MGFLNRIFNKSQTAKRQVQPKRSFIECVDVLQAWKLKASVDPDIVTPDDPVLNSAFASVVCCPYCANDIVFGDAIVSSGMTMRICCPVCKVEPSLQRAF